MGVGGLSDRQMKSSPHTYMCVVISINAVYELLLVCLDSYFIFLWLFFSPALSSLISHIVCLFFNFVLIFVTFRNRINSSRAESCL